MDNDTERERAPRTDAYWRRRVYVLGGGLAFIGLIAWSCSGPGPHKSTAQLRDAAAAASLSPLAAPTGTGSSTPSATPSPGALASAKPSVKPSAQPTKRRPGDVCADADVVMTLTATKTTYKGGEHPRFRLSVVNTNRIPCTFDVGPKNLDVRIVSGTDRVWSSAQCMGAASSIQMLPRGVPYIATIDWNRKRCGTDPSRADPGTYVVDARAGGLKTARQVFFLR